MDKATLELIGEVVEARTEYLRNPETDEGRLEAALDALEPVETWVDAPARDADGLQAIYEIQTARAMQAKGCGSDEGVHMALEDLADWLAWYTRGWRD